MNDLGFVFLALRGNRLAGWVGQMRFVVGWQWRHLANSARKEIFLCFGFAKGCNARSLFSSCLGLRRRNLLLNLFEVLKRLKFHPRMLPQAVCVWDLVLQNTLLSH